jgi:hypothetical protein
MPVYWKPKYGTRSSRHRAWVKQEEKREAGSSASAQARCVSGSDGCSGDKETGPGDR